MNPSSNLGYTLESPVEIFKIPNLGPHRLSFKSELVGLRGHGHSHFFQSPK